MRDQPHRGHYKKLPNHVEAFGPDGRSLGVIFQTTSPFDTPRQMEALVAWNREALETGELHLRQLTEAGRLRLQGAGRGAWYEIA